MERSLKEEMFADELSEKAKDAVMKERAQPRSVMAVMPLASFVHLLTLFCTTAFSNVHPLARTR